MASRGEAQTRSVPLGRLMITPGALAALAEADVVRALGWHARGEWGDLCPEDWRANDQALKLGSRLLSSYRSFSGVKFWIITECDRSATTVLLPEEY